MSDLKVGMKHEEVRNKLKNYPKPKRDMLKNSMCNQVKLAEGEGSANALKKEINHMDWRGGCDTNFTNCKTMTVTCGVCLKPCKYKGTSMCDSCLRFDKFEKMEGK